MMINPTKASYSMAPTMVACALAGFLTACLFVKTPQRHRRLVLTMLIGFLLGLAVNFRLANLFLSAGYFLFFAVRIFAVAEDGNVSAGRRCSGWHSWRAWRRP